MNVKELLSRFTMEELKNLTAATSAEALSQAAEAMGHNLKAEEAEAAFAALYPVRGKEVFDEAELKEVTGGMRLPTPTMPVIERSNPNYL